MRIVLFVVVVLLSLFWIYLSFSFFVLENIFNYNSFLFEFIFFIGLFVFGFYLGRFFCFEEKKNNNKKYKKMIDDLSFKEKEEDNLKIIEGIGPKVEELLKLNGIKTMKDLSESSYDELKLILERAGDNFKIINPRTWSYQAELAVKKEWGKLKEYQDFLVGGVDPNKLD